MPYDPMMSNIDHRIEETKKEIELLEGLWSLTINPKSENWEHYQAYKRLIAKCKNELERQKYEKQRH